MIIRVEEKVVIFSSVGMQFTLILDYWPSLTPQKNIKNCFKMHKIYSASSLYICTNVHGISKHLK